ncbi:gluconate 2-dehydrogenase subunit 3 family protein [Sphingobacterium daejeonense]|uniref:gluconate 2-dehydrogenase subunit 3 family protein n=1 Tax=Sphingobacterium daejeonense TaxID=371142 RepID=UPI0010C2B63F|nr:Uncharacterised protein [Sphingobacterium daejeonense]
MNRRDSLKALGLIAAGSGVLASACKDEKGQATKVATEGSSDMMPGVQEFEHKRTEALKAEKFFTEHEMATITVLADIIIPKDDVSGSASEAGVPAFIEFYVQRYSELSNSFERWIEMAGCAMPENLWKCLHQMQKRSTDSDD